jgi:hypothetical protein
VTDAEDVDLEVGAVVAFMKTVATGGALRAAATGEWAAATAERAVAEPVLLQLLAPDEVMPLRWNLHSWQLLAANETSAYQFVTKFESSFSR